MQKDQSRRFYKRAIRFVLQGARKARAKLREFNRRTRAFYSPTRMALISCALVFLMCCFTLFLPPYLGVSNDGSFDTLLQDVGLKRMDASDDSAYFSYYERTYRIEPWRYAPGTSNLAVRLLARTAIFADTLLTQDDIFDMRVLALFYVVFYVLALYPVARFALTRVSNFMEGIVIVITFALIFGDASLVVRFASFYTEPLLLVAYIGAVGTMLVPVQGKPRYWVLFSLLVCSALILWANPYCAMLGIIATAICIRMIQLRTETAWRAMCVFCAISLSLLSIFAFSMLMGQRSLVREYHAMTRGVLLQSENPEKTLASFAIDPRYSILTDTYADQNYPVVLVESESLQSGFFDKYDHGDIALHYLKNPGDWVAMLDLGVKAAFVTRPSFSGNFERSVGLPPMAKTPLLSLWSNFKERSAPKTIGFLVLLVAGLVFIFRRKRTMRPTYEEKQHGFLVSALISTVLFALLEISTVFVFSGDAEFLREGFLLSVNLDLWMLFFIAEVLHRTRIIKVES